MPNTLASTAVGPFDILTQAGILWNSLKQKEKHPAFNVKLLSIDGNSVTCNNGLVLPVEGGLDQLPDMDIVIISAADITSLSDFPSQLSTALIHFYDQGGFLSSVCTGAFALTHTGLLNGKKATTHWGMAPIFRECYPEVNLMEDHLVTEDDRFFCSGGISAYQDLSLRLIEFFGGYQLAEETARALILSGQRASQSPFRKLESLKQHQDKNIHKVQDHIEQHYEKKLLIHDIADKFHMSQRQLERRFKQAVGETIGNYIQIVRVEVARNLLRAHKTPITHISSEIGYQDAAHFRRIFTRWTHLTPTAYRQKYLHQEKPSPDGQ